jgi:hypothetical protein
MLKAWATRTNIGSAAAVGAYIICIARVLVPVGERVRRGTSEPSTRTPSLFTSPLIALTAVTDIVFKEFRGTSSVQVPPVVARIIITIKHHRISADATDP